MAGATIPQTRRLYYVGLFIFFGLIIALSTSIVNYRLEIGSMRAEFDRQAEEIYEEKLLEIGDYLSGLEYIVSALQGSNLLVDYLNNPNPVTYQNVIEVFRGVTISNPSLMQARYLDAQGKEKIRIDWIFGKERPFAVPEKDLQDKRHRYYFTETSKILPQSFWYSKLDLNVENRKIEIPYKPVLRIGAPVYLAQKFEGVVIINVHAKEFLNTFINNPVFDISLIDGDGYFLQSHEEGRSWSRYLETGYTVETEYPDSFKEILYRDLGVKLTRLDDLYIGSVKAFLESDQAILLLHAKKDLMQSMQRERQKAALLIVAIIFALSVPLALLISKRPADLHRKIAEQNRTLTDSMLLIDRNIHTGMLDDQGRFIEVSTALANRLGIPKDQFPGMAFRNLYGNNLSPKEYNKIWQSLQQGHTWSGDLQHVKENGDSYWADTVLVPTHDDENHIKGFTALFQDITDKKHVEELSITDVMTGLYNRRFFNSVIEKELGRALRDGKQFSFAMLDVDFFKNYNDNYGHQKGDQVLRSVAGVIKSKLTRGSDYCFRLGGEEFGVLFTDLSPKQARDFVETIRTAIVEKELEHKWSRTAGVVTVSIGLLTLTPFDGAEVDLIYRLADEALYKAKRKGKNQVVNEVLDATI